MSAVHTSYKITSSSSSSTFSQSSSTGSISVISTAASLVFESNALLGAPAPSVIVAQPSQPAPAVSQPTQSSAMFAPLSEVERMRYVYRTNSPAHAGELLRFECTIPMNASLLKATSGPLDNALVWKDSTLQKVWGPLEDLLNTHLKENGVRFAPHSVATANNHLYFGVIVTNQTKAAWTEERSLAILNLLEKLGCSKFAAAKDQCHVYVTPMPLTS